MVRSVTDNELVKEIEDSDVPVLVDLWAAWCGPCRMLGPVIDEISSDLGGKIKVVKLNVDENPVTTMQYRVSSIPTVLLFKNGKLVESMVGFRPKQALIPVIEKHL